MVLDCSTINPIASKNFSQMAKKYGLTFLDTPMSGGTKGAENGALNFMVGAETEEDLKRAEEVLYAMGTKITHCGEPGAGSGTKISHNLVLNI
jgi:3-hydroxyisobutyrate dehydrogenase